MCSKTKTEEFMNNYFNKVTQLKDAINNAEAIVVGAGAGLSTAAGFAYSGPIFENYFSDFIDQYGFSDMYSAGFYQFETLEEYWAYWSRQIYINRYLEHDLTVYKQLLELVKDKDYFVITTNVDHCFQRSGFDKQRLFYTQGDYGLFQCSEPCQMITYDNKDQIIKMIEYQKNMRIPSSLIPYCPICGRPMTTNLRVDGSFVEDEGWHKASQRYHDFLKKYENRHILFLELGIGANTPVIIKYPFWQMTYQNKKATYACINLHNNYPDQIKNQTIAIDEDIAQVFHDI